MVNKWPVIEIFGPTIQGEGIDQGVSTHFVRFGGCDYRCVWCDTPYAVIPSEVRENITRMTAAEIVKAVLMLTPQSPTDPVETWDAGVPWIVLSGGNPALHQLGDLVQSLQDFGFKVAVETQGSLWREWMREVDRLCISPKPPSAKVSKAVLHSFDSFFQWAQALNQPARREHDWMFVKIPIFEQRDLDFAQLIHARTAGACKLYLSAGNDAGRTVGNPNRVDDRHIADVRSQLCTQYEWLIRAVHERPQLRRASDVVVQAQGHVLAWGNERGV